MRGRADGAMEERTGRRMDEGHFLTPVTPVGYLGKRDRVRKKKQWGEKNNWNQIYYWIFHMAT